MSQRIPQRLACLALATSIAALGGAERAAAAPMACTVAPTGAGGGGGMGAAAQLQAGAAVVNLTLPEGVPLAGYSGRRTFPDVFGLHPYAHYFPPSEKAPIGEEIRAKALVLERGGKRLVFVSLDTVGVDTGLRDEITAKLTAPPHSFEEDAILLSATHTHSGPGALTKNHFLEYAATDRLHEGFRASFVDQVVKVVADAAATLKAARLYPFAKEAPELHKNRTRDQAYGDHTLNLLAVRDTGGAKWMGALVNFAVHGTAHGESNKHLSADYPGALERAFAKALAPADPSKLPVLFLNGAEGDVRPKHPPGDMQDELDLYADARWDEWWDDLAPPPPLPDQPWTIEHCDVPLGGPFLYLRSELKPFHDVIPLSLLGIELETYFPLKARIWSISLAGMRFLTIPGEATSEVGLELRAAAQQVGASSVWILGLTNGHLGYFTSRADWRLASYESGGSAYGAYGSRRLRNYHLWLLRP